MSGRVLRVRRRWLLRTIGACAAGVLMLGAVVSARVSATATARSPWLDAGFGSQGEVHVDTGGSFESYVDVSSAPGGHLQATGRSANTTYVTRFTATGALDPAWGVGGTYTMTGGCGIGGASVVRADGSTLVATCAQTGNHIAGVVFALTTTGSLDDGFGSSGTLVADPTPAQDGVCSCFVRLFDVGGGKFVAVGRRYFSPDGGTWFLARFSGTGTLDGSFGTGGIVSGDRVFDVSDAAIDGSGRFVLASTEGVARLSSAGTLDSSFGTGGVAPNPIIGLDTRVVIQAAGRIVLGTAEGCSARVVGLDGTGSIDPTYGRFGTEALEIPLPNSTTCLSSMRMAALSTGDTLVTLNVNNGYQLALVALDRDGYRDRSFGDNSQILTTYLGDYAATRGVVEMSDRTIAAVGDWGAGAGPDSLVLRFRNPWQWAPALDPQPGSLQPLPNDRVYDSREDYAGCVAAGGPRTIDMSHEHGVPSYADSAVLNVTVTGATQDSWLTIYPAGTAAPSSSNLNFAPGQTVPNTVIAKLGPSGAIIASNARGCVHVIVDVVGWYAAPSPQPEAGGFVGMAPVRLFDSRDVGSGPCFGPDQPRDVTVAGVHGVPADASAVAVNVTVTEPTTESWLTVYPKGAAQPTASNLNYTAGKTVPNLVVVKVGTAGKISIVNARGCAHVVVDIVGYYVAAPSVADPGGLTTITPTRLLDTRDPAQGPKLTFGYGRSLVIAGTHGVPADAKAVVLNVTITETTGTGWLSVQPAAPVAANTSSLNFTPGLTVANLVVVKIGDGGAVNSYVAGDPSASAHLVIDLAGWTT